VTGPAPSVTGEASEEPSRPPEAAAQRTGAGIARGAAIIAGLTIISRMLGLVRTLVFSQTVGAGCLGTAYVTANQVPNLVYELVLGGALTSAMVPVLARSAERSATDPGEKARVGQITSALLTWSVIILVPLTIAIAAAASPIASALNPANPNAHCVHADVVATTDSMIRVFSPQILLYGLSVVLYGLLQAYRRFTGPALAPVISSLVLISSYIAFVPLGHGLPLARLPVDAQLVLSVGATMGVAMLVLVSLIPALRLRLRLRPQFAFPPGVARQAGGLALVGVAELLADDLSTIVIIALANGRGTTGAIVIFNYAWQAFSSVHAVLVISIAVSAFPVLSARDGDTFDRTCAGSTRAVILASWLGTAVLLAIAIPASHVLARSHTQVSELIEGFTLFAPAFVGMGIVANLSRVMLALGKLKVAGLALAGSWLLIIVADVILAGLAPPHLVVGALALGAAIGETVVAVPLAIATRRIRGAASMAGVRHATLAGLAAAAAGAIVGTGFSLIVPVDHKLAAAGGAVGAAILATLVFGVVAYLLDDGDLRVILGRARRVLRRA
jgi:putative peptidoglycan lipid II flippase